MEHLETAIASLVMDGARARGCAMEAIRSAKAGDIAAATATGRCDGALERARAFRTGLMQWGSRRERVPLRLFLMNAQDHLMNAAARSPAVERVDPHRRLTGEAGK